MVYHKAECEEDASGGVTIEGRAAKLTVCDTAWKGLTKQRCVMYCFRPFCQYKMPTEKGSEKMTV